MSNIAVTHAPSGLVHAFVARTERVTPHMVRVTLTGDDLGRFEHRGFDQWFRLAVPVDDHARFDNLPSRFATGGYLRYLTLPKATRPVIRSYTVRAFRPEVRELDVDFVCHGSVGVAGPWAQEVEPGTEVAFIDQGCGWAPVPSDWTLLVADESGLPAVAGILRDMPRDAVGHAVVELPDADDAQEVDAPAGMTVHWLPRGAADRVGDRALTHLREMLWPDGVPYAFAVGESRLATGARRFLVAERAVPKTHVTFCGYWKQGASR
jgi:NADPH-dependent ferric siderophore reductase